MDMEWRAGHQTHTQAFSREGPRRPRILVLCNGLRYLESLSWFFWAWIFLKDQVPPACHPDSFHHNLCSPAFLGDTWWVFWATKGFLSLPGLLPIPLCFLGAGGDAKEGLPSKQVLMCPQGLGKSSFLTRHRELGYPGHKECALFSKL